LGCVGGVDGNLTFVKMRKDAPRNRLVGIRMTVSDKHVEHRRVDLREPESQAPSLLNQMVVERIADEVGGGFEMQFVEQSGSIGADGFHAQCQLFADISYGMALG
jgi:hypothetical protein